MAIGAKKSRQTMKMQAAPLRGISHLIQKLTGAADLLETIYGESSGRPKRLAVRQMAKGLRASAVKSAATLSECKGFTLPPLIHTIYTEFACMERIHGKQPQSITAELALSGPAEDASASAGEDGCRKSIGIQQLPAEHRHAAQITIVENIFEKPVRGWHGG